MIDLVDAHIVMSVASAFKASNGNMHIKNNDILIYIMERIDSLPCAVQGRDIVRALSWVSIFKFFIPISVTVICILLGYIGFK